MMRVLISHGADPTLTQKNGTTALMLAAGGLDDARREADTLAAVDFCLQNGVAINASNSAGDTALHKAAETGAHGVIRLLAERGAALDVKNTRGHTPLDVARQSGREGDRAATVALLIDLLARTK
jgi:ankyrin repeat protein